MIDPEEKLLAAIREEESDFTEALREANDILYPDPVKALAAAISERKTAVREWKDCLKRCDALTADLEAIRGMVGRPETTIVEAVRRYYDDDRGSAAAAVYVRERLTASHAAVLRAAEARRIALEVGAIIRIDGRTHHVERRTGERTWRLRGVARGVVDLAAPHNPDLVLRWWAWRGGLGARNARLLTLTRDAAGHFTTAR